MAPIAPHGMAPHPMAPHPMALHPMAPHPMTPQGMPPQGMPPHPMALYPPHAQYYQPHHAQYNPYAPPPYFAPPQLPSPSPSPQLQRIDRQLQELRAAQAMNPTEGRATQIAGLEYDKSFTQ